MKSKCFDHGFKLYRLALILTSPNILGEWIGHNFVRLNTKFVSESKKYIYSDAADVKGDELIKYRL